MAVDLAKYVVSLEANSRQLVTELDKANRKLDAFHKQQTNALEKVRSGFAKLGIGISAALVVSAITRFTAASLAMADQIADVSKAAGVSAETLQRLRFAFGDLAGVTEGQTDAALQRFNKTLGDAIQGSVKAQKAFSELGVEFVDASGHLVGTEEALRDTLGELAAIQSGAERASRAAELFGKEAGPKIAVALADGIDALEETEAQLKGLLTNENVADANALKDAFARMGKEIAGPLRNAVISVTADLAVMFGLMDRSPVRQLEHDLKIVQSRIAALQATIKQQNLGPLSGAADLLKKDLALQGDLLMQITQIERGLAQAAKDTGTAVVTATDAQIESIERQIQALKTEAATFGFTRSEVTLYKLELEGASVAQLDLARTALATIDALERQAEAAKAAREVPMTFSDFGVTGMPQMMDPNLIDVHEQMAEAERGLTEQIEIEHQRRLASAHEASQAELELRQATINTGLGLLHALGNEHRGAAIAALAFEKAMAIKSVLIEAAAARAKIAANTKVAMMRALADAGPFAGPAIASAIAAKGAAAMASVTLMSGIQAGLIGATGLVEAAQLSSRGTQALQGTTANPTNTRQVGAAAGGAVGASRQSVVEVHIGAMYGWDEHVTRKLVEAIRSATDGKDVILFGSGSRQAQIMRTP